MIAVIILGCFMVGINIMFSYLELIPYIDAIKEDINTIAKFKRTIYPKGIIGDIQNFFDSIYIGIQQFIQYIILPFKLLSHIHLLLPTLIDIVAMYFLTHMFALGNSLAGGLTGLFASNFVSIIVFCKTHNISIWGTVKYAFKFVFSGFKIPNKYKYQTTHVEYKII